MSSAACFCRTLQWARKPGVPEPGGALSGAAHTLHPSYAAGLLGLHRCAAHLRIVELLSRMKQASHSRASALASIVLPARGARSARESQG